MPSSITYLIQTSVYLSGTWFSVASKRHLYIKKVELHAPKMIIINMIGGTFKTI